MTLEHRHMPKFLSALLLHVLAALALFLPATPAIGMDFRIYFQPELKQRLIIAEGVISEGDDAKFRIAVQSADRDAKGYVTLVLDSLGGSVSAAFALVRAMDEVKVYALVPDNALCASACASILYISAPRHLVVGSGRLGFHTCYVARGESNDASPLCNDAIAENAVSHGTDYALVDIWNYDYGPTKMAWLDKKGACQIGLCRP